MDRYMDHRQINKEIGIQIDGKDINVWINKWIDR